MIAFNDSLNGGLQIPFSVIMAVIYWLGVTSKAGLKVTESLGATVTPSMQTTSSSLLNSIGICSPEERDRSIVEVGTTA